MICIALIIAASVLGDILENIPEGSAVLMQKPMGENIEQADRIMKICREKKLTAGTVTESTTYIADANNCYFDLDIIDKDSAEHIYSFYKFRFSTNAE